jgi:hypothetical protein
LSIAIEQERSLIVKTPKAGGPRRSRLLHAESRISPALSFFPQALAVPAASSMEAAAYAVAEASDMGDTHAVGETATPKMGDIHAAVGETAASEMGGTYAAAETHAVIDDRPLGAHPVIEAATFEVGEPRALVDVADAASHSMVETVIAKAG